MAPNHTKDSKAICLPDAHKRPSNAPRLTVHGTVAELTASKLGGRQINGVGYLTAA